jgi:hypothetical protein
MINAHDFDVFINLDKQATVDGLRNEVYPMGI